MARVILISASILLAPATAGASAPSDGDLAAAIKAGNFAGYLTSVSAWLGDRTPAAEKVSEASLLGLLKDPAVLKALCQRQLIAKTGADQLGRFAKCDAANARFLGWLLSNAEAMDLYLIGATPTGLARRERNDYALDLQALDIWRKIHDADPDSRAGLYLRLAIATALSPPPPMSYVGAWGIGGVPIDPVGRYRSYRKAREDGQLLPIFETLSVWEYRTVVCDWASTPELAWARQMLRTWRPDLLKDQRVYRIVSEVQYRSPIIPFSKGFPTVIESGGKCGPRSWFGTMMCRAFGIPAVGIGQPGHAAFAIKAADPKAGPQPGSVWKVLYGRGWQVSKCGGVTGPQFVAEAEARAREPQFSSGEHLRWLAATLASRDQAAAVLALVPKVQPPVEPRDDGVVAAPGVDRSSPMPVTKPVAEPPFKPPAGVIHVEAESLSSQSGARVYDCATGGKQVNFDKNVKESWAAYQIDAPAAGEYYLVVRLATPNRDQVLHVRCGDNPPVAIQAPNTTGLWDTTAPATITLGKGTQTIRLSVPYQRGMAIRWFDLKAK